MKRIFIILIFLCTAVVNYGQDKIIFKDGTKRNCKIVSVNKSTVTFKDSLNGTALITKSKSEIIVAEYASGAVYIFGDEKTAEDNTVDKKPDAKPTVKKAKQQVNDEMNNMLGSQLFSSFFGRTGLVYERFINNKQMGIAVPLFVSYAPYSNSIGGQSSGSNSNINFITGVDLNYYFATKSKYTQFFVGPRVRYGTDVMIANITGLSLQAQNGVLIHSRTNPKIAHTFAFGFGFVRIISTPKSGNFDPKQSYPWLSLTYRFNVKW